MATDWYQEKLAQTKSEQAGKSNEEIADSLQAEHVFDPATAPKQNHIWVDRGLKLSCETASHPYHQSWKRGKVPM